MFCKNCGANINPKNSFCKNCGDRITRQKRKFYNIVLWFKKYKGFSILLCLVLLIIFISIFGGGNNDTNYTNIINTIVDKIKNTQKNSSIQQNIQDNNLGSVINIVCDNNEGGSGTIINKDGLILTNNHVISGSTFCFVTLPDKITGQPMKIYKAKPIIISDLSEKYDLAGLSIVDSYTDNNGEIWGTYPTTFHFFSAPDSCNNYSPSLNESITVYGYPVTSGGYNLTVTGGVISSFSDDGKILTDAKIDSGNSGGLAINQDGCFIGIPSAVISGNYQSLGVIIPQSLIDKFINQIPNN